MSDKVINEHVGYFEKDVKYDKTFYYNTWQDWVKILAALGFYYGLHVIVFWGHISLGTCFPEENMWLNVALFIFACVWIAFNVVLGHFSNKKLRLLEFYRVKISEKDQEIRDNLMMEEQKRIQAEKMLEKELQR